MIKRLLYATTIVLILSAARMFAQDKPAASQKEQDPLAPLTWLVGGTWSVDVKDAQDGHITHVLNRPAWSANHRAIIFNVDFDGQPHYYGFYAYNPATKKIDFYYTSSDGELTNGTATPDADGKTLRQEFDIMHLNGTTGHLRSTIERDGENAYWLTVFTSKTGQWQQAFRIRYQRKAE